MNITIGMIYNQLKTCCVLGVLVHHYYASDRRRITPRVLMTSTPAPPRGVATTGFLRLITFLAGALQLLALQCW